MPATHSTAHGPCESARPGTGHTKPTTNPPMRAMGTKCRQKKVTALAKNFDPWATGATSELPDAVGVVGMVGAAGREGSGGDADFLGGEGTPDSISEGGGAEGLCGCVSVAKTEA